MRRTVYFVSDGTAITVETLGRSLLTQFQAIDFQYVVLSFVDTPEAAQAAVQRINETPDEQLPLVFSTLVDPATASLLQQAKAEVMDLFGAFIKPLEKALGTASSHSMGLSHSMQTKKPTNAVLMPSTMPSIVTTVQAFTTTKIATLLLWESLAAVKPPPVSTLPCNLV